MAAKVYVTNNHSIDREFEVEGGGVQLVAAGATEHFNLAATAQNDADQRMGLISVSDKEPKSATNATTSAETASAKAPAQSPTGAKKES